MKKMFILLLSATLIPQHLLADVESEYNRNRLVIQYYSGVTGAWTEVAGGFRSYSDWKYFQGFREITEIEFLEIAGYLEEAEQAAQRNKTANLWLISSLGLIGSGLLIFASSDHQLEGLDSHETIGIIVLSTSIPTLLMWSKYYGHRMPLEQAYAIQEEYNRKLLTSLKAEN